MEKMNVGEKTKVMKTSSQPSAIHTIIDQK